MPTYEYLCLECQNQFEELHLSLSQIPAEIKCPACGSLNTRRRMSAPAVQMGSDNPGNEHREPVDGGKRIKGPVFGRKELNQLSKK